MIGGEESVGVDFLPPDFHAATESAQNESTAAQTEEPEVLSRQSFDIADEHENEAEIPDKSISKQNEQETFIPEPDSSTVDKSDSEKNLSEEQKPETHEMSMLGEKEQAKSVPESESVVGEIFTAQNPNVQADLEAAETGETRLDTLRTENNDSKEPIFVDHFSLQAPSSTVRFRNTRVLVYEQRSDQMLLEDRGPSNGTMTNDPEPHVITVKRMRSGSFGLQFLRMTYTLIALLMVGFLFVFCFQIILFLFLNMPQATPIKLVGAILSVPVFLVGMAKIMAMGVAFISDTWNGHRLFQRMSNSSIVAVEWFCFVVFLGIPTLTCVSCLLSRKDNWWEITVVVWVIIVFAFFVVFFLMVVRHEISSCFKLIRLLEDNELDGSGGWLRLAKHAILMREIQNYSGLRKERYLIEGDKEAPTGGYALSADYEPFKTYISVYSWFTKLASRSVFFDELDQPVRNYSAEEVRDIMPFVTAKTWSLEKMCCQASGSRMVTVVSGPSSLRPNQFISSIACNLLAMLLIALLITGVLVWMSFDGKMIALFAVLFGLFCFLPVATHSVRFFRSYRNIRRVLDGDGRNGALNTGDNSQRNDKTVLQIIETVRITQPRPWLCWTLFSLSASLLFLWPLISLIATNWKISLVYLFLGGFTFVRKFFNVAVVLAEFGSLSGIDIPLKRSKAETSAKTGGTLANIIDSSRRIETDQVRVMRKKARISKIVGKVSNNHNVTAWMWVFAFFIVAIFVMFISALGSGETAAYQNKLINDLVMNNGILPVGEFYYPQQQYLPYPTCELKKGFEIPGVGSTSLGDYGFLAALSYASPEESKILLDQWFGEGKVRDMHELVAQYRKDSDTEKNPISYKLFTFPDLPEFAVLSVRGSETIWDWVVNIQLWSAAGLAQVVQSIIPFGWAFTPILNELIYAVNSLQSETLKSVSYYKQTTNFVQEILSGYGNTGIKTMRSTGASLGGGIAIITGAQTEASAVAISGINAMLSRDTFDPPLTKEQINTRTFNVIPDRDIIASLGGKGRLYQNVDCQAPMNSLAGCHSMWRTICEIEYQCGSGDRPVLCRCNRLYGYPPPEQNGTRTFDQACPS